MNNEAGQRNRALSKVEKIIEGSATAEKLLSIFKAVLGSTPLAGGIASLISDYIPSARFRRLERFAEAVAGDLKRFEDRVRTDYIESDDFAFMFERCFRGAAENPQQEKLKAFRGMLINSAIRGDLSEEQREYFLNLANNLSVLHIRILRFMALPRQYLADADISENRISGGFSQMFSVAMPGVDIPVIKAAFGELYQYDLINTDKSIFSTMTSAQGIHLLGNRVSALGTAFIDFCTVPS